MQPKRQNNYGDTGGKENFWRDVCVVHSEFKGLANDSMWGTEKRKIVRSESTELGGRQSYSQKNEKIQKEASSIGEVVILWLMVQFVYYL